MTTDGSSATVEVDAVLRDCTPENIVGAGSSEDPERIDAPRAPSPIGPPANAPPPLEEVTRSRLMAHYAGLTSASMIGCLLRLALEALGDYQGRAVFPVAWAQGIGCLIMGLVSERKNDIISIYPPIYTFLTTGVAGSTTTFSTWMLEGYLAFSNESGYARNAFRSTTDGFAYSFATYFLSLGALHVGAHVAYVFPFAHVSRLRQNRQIACSEKTGSVHQHKTTPITDAIVILTAAIAYLIAFLLYFLAPHSWRHRAIFPILLAPPGAIFRFALSDLNVRPIFTLRFPLGTFLANMVATAVGAGSYAAQRSSAGQGVARCDALYAVQEGFCGCLSTVSTFVVETRHLPAQRWKWVYASLSIILGHLLVLTVLLSVKPTNFDVVCTGSD